MIPLPADSSAKQLLGGAQAWRYRVLPLECQPSGTYRVATDVAPAEWNILERQIAALTGQRIELVQVDSSTLEKRLASTYRTDGHVVEVAASEQFIERLLREALNLGASDIHLEPLPDRVRVRMRVDGRLIVRQDLPAALHARYVNVVKVSANLDISQSRLPQDGRISFTEGGHEVDLRVSVLPSFHGEKVVMRILDRSKRAPALQDLGMTADQLRAYRTALSRESGIVLISGPTGSGKTTTLYATLESLNKESVNITTVEDPVEYTIAGITQTHIRPAIGLTFSAALKSFLRQDPNVIMLGEIRDAETAEMAVRASNTGHLVLSTIHTNDAWGIVARLIDMGAAPRLLQATLRLLLAQRLLRKLCDACAVWIEEPAPLTLDDITIAYLDRPLRHRVHVGCEACYFTGYRDRFALYEVISVDRHVRQAMLAHEQALSIAYATLAEQAEHAIRQGRTSAVEALQLLTPAEPSVLAARTPSRAASAAA